MRTNFSGESVPFFSSSPPMGSTLKSVAAHRYIVGVNNMYFPSAAIEMVGYLTMTLLASLLLRWVEKRMDGSDSYDLVQADALTMSAGTYSHPSKGTPFDERSKEYRGDAWEEKGER